MTGLGGLNKSPNGVVIGLVQMQLPNVVTPADLKAQAERVAMLVAKARRGSAAMDLVVFPEYSLHGLSMDTNPAIMCRMDGPEVALFRATCREQRIWGCFSLMELNPGGYPYNSGIIIDDPRSSCALAIWFESSTRSTLEPLQPFAGPTTRLMLSSLRTVREF